MILFNPIFHIGIIYATNNDKSNAMHFETELVPFFHHSHLQHSNINQETQKEIQENAVHEIISSDAKCSTFSDNFNPLMSFAIYCTEVYDWNSDLSTLSSCDFPISDHTSNTAGISDNEESLKKEPIAKEEEGRIAVVNTVLENQPLPMALPNSLSPSLSSGKYRYKSKHNSSRFVPHVRRRLSFFKKEYFPNLVGTLSENQTSSKPYSRQNKYLRTYERNPKKRNQNPN